MDVRDRGPDTAQGISVADPCSSGVRRIFERRGLARSQKFEKVDKNQMRNMKTKKMKIKNKGFYSNLARSSVQI